MMRIAVKVKPNAKKESVVKAGAGSLFATPGMEEYAVAVKAPPKEGKANEAVIRALAEHFGVPPSRVRIVSGHAARRKVVEIQPGG